MVQIVSSRGLAVPIPELEITRIRGILNQELRFESHPYLTAGRRVRVKAGPLAGFGGILVRRKNKICFVVSLELIQRSVAVEIEEAQLEALS
jgi:transcription termination/antitermination protein NusG